jgi:16S rRNA (guanine966-N2)-methyltransferase
MVGPETVEGARVLDLYAGTGILAIEALSRGAAWADLVEISARSVRTIRENLGDLSLSEQAKVCRAGAVAALKSLPGGYSLVFADPPYDLDEWESLMVGLGSGDLLAEEGIVVAEHRHGAAMTERYGSLVRVKSRRYGDTAITIYKAEVSNG